MVEGRIIRRSLRHPDGDHREWFEIETVHNGKPHRDSDHAYRTEEEARTAAMKQCDQVDQTVYER